MTITLSFCFTGMSHTFGNVDAHELFKGVFGPNFNIFSDNVFEDMDWADGHGGMGSRMNSFSSNRRFSQPGFPMGAGHPFQSGGGFGNDMFVNMMPENAGRSKMPTVEYDLKLSLEELFSGCQKKMKITRKRLRNNAFQSESKTVEIAVKPGWKSGTKITFQGDGDEDEMRSAGDVVFKVAEKPHPVYQRSDNDLTYTLRLPLRDVSHN